MLFSSLTQKKTSNQHEITSKQPEIAGQTGPAAYNNDLTGDCANLENKEDPATLGQLDNQAHTCQYFIFLCAYIPVLRYFRYFCL